MLKAHGLGLRRVLLVDQEEFSICVSLRDLRSRVWNLGIAV